ncbi:MAG: peptidylprolyl isomerase [Deltaproteobacteria bacterium]|nr:peptidylprolyl isomerase [Deltaproteobacteria bacterium]
MKSKILFVAGIFLIFFSTALYAAFEDRIVAIVNDDVITLSELEVTLQPVMERIKKIPEEKKRKEVTAQARMAVMNQLINRMLIEQEAAKRKIAVTDEEVNRALENLLKAKGISVQKFKETMAAQDLTLKTYKDEIRRERIKGKVIERTVKSKVSISEEEIGKYYAKHREEYEGKAATRIRQILIVKPKDAPDSATKTLRTQAEAVLKKLKKGESFDLLVGTHSQGPAAGSGGDLGFVEKGMMFPEVDTVAFSLQKGEISEVIESPVGFHIIKITDRRGAGIKPIEEVRQEIFGKIGNEKMKKKFEEWFKELREKSLIEIRL